MLEKFTEEARDTLLLSQYEAQRLDHNWLGTEHLLIGLLRKRADSTYAPGVAARALAESSVTVEVGVRVAAAQDLTLSSERNV